jgi:hypothetical protein
MDERFNKIKIMEISKELEEQIVNFGVFDYSSKKIASILGEDELKIKELMNDKNSEFSKLLLKGKDMSDYMIDIKLFELARAGDLKALDKLDARKKK